MAETVAHLSDHVFPRLPVRQWVLSVPKRLRQYMQRDGAVQNTATTEPQPDTASVKPAPERSIFRPKQGCHHRATLGNPAWLKPHAHSLGTRLCPLRWCFPAMWPPLEYQIACGKRKKVNLNPEQ